MTTQSAKFIEHIIENLPDMSELQAQGWIKNSPHLKRVLRVLAETPSDPKIWKRIQLGTGIKNGDEFKQAIHIKRMRIGESANDILERPGFTVATKRTEVNLVVKSVSELGFENGALLKQIYEAAGKRDLKLCPNEVGPQLRLQYKDQPNGEVLVIAMVPVTD